MEKSGVGLFHGFPARHFHSEPTIMPVLAQMSWWRAAQDQILLYRKPRKMPTSSDSLVEPFFVSDVGDSDNDVKLFGGVAELADLNLQHPERENQRCCFQTFYLALAMHGQIGT